MAIIMTRHAFGNRDVLSEQLGDAISVADGATSAELEAGIYRIFASNDCTVRFGSLSAVGGEPWSAGGTEARYVKGGTRLSVSAR